MRKTLFQVTIEKLRHRDRTLTFERIAQSIDVSESWIASLLSANPPKNASVNSVQKLYEFLTDKPLQY